MDDEINGTKNPIFGIMENIEINNNNNNNELAYSFQFGSNLENPNMTMNMNNLSVNNNALNNGLQNPTDENLKNISSKAIFFEAYDEIDEKKDVFNNNVYYK